MSDKYVYYKTDTLEEVLSIANGEIDFDFVTVSGTTISHLIKLDEDIITFYPTPPPGAWNLWDDDPTTAVDLTTLNTYLYVLPLLGWIDVVHGNQISVITQMTYQTTIPTISQYTIKNIRKQFEPLGTRMVIRATPNTIVEMALQNYDHVNPPFYIDRNYILEGTILAVTGVDGIARLPNGELPDLPSNEVLLPNNTWWSIKIGGNGPYNYHVPTGWKVELSSLTPF